jgi:hypothetical protein
MTAMKILSSVNRGRISQGISKSHVHRSIKGVPPEFYRRFASAGMKTLQHLRATAQETDASDFNLLFTTLLNQALQVKAPEDFYEDVALEMALIVANIIDGPPGLDMQDPVSLKEAMNLPDWTQWKKACHSEILSLKERDVFELVELPLGEI